MPRSKPIIWDEEVEDEVDPLCDIVCVHDTYLVNDTEDEGKTIDEEVSAKKQIAFPKFVLRETNDYNVLLRIFKFYILYKHNLPMAIQEIIIETINK